MLSEVFPRFILKQRREVTSADCWSPWQGHFSVMSYTNALIRKTPFPFPLKLYILIGPPACGSDGSDL